MADNDRTARELLGLLQGDSRIRNSGGRVEVRSDSGQWLPLDQSSQEISESPVIYRRRGGRTAVMDSVIRVTRNRFYRRDRASAQTLTRWTERTSYNDLLKDRTEPVEGGVWRSVRRSPAFVMQKGAVIVIAIPYLHDSLTNYNALPPERFRPYRLSVVTSLDGGMTWRLPEVLISQLVNPEEGADGVIDANETGERNGGDVVPLHGCVLSDGFLLTTDNYARSWFSPDGLSWSSSDPGGNVVKRFTAYPEFASNRQRKIIGIGSISEQINGSFSVVGMTLSATQNKGQSWEEVFRFTRGTHHGGGGIQWNPSGWVLAHSYRLDNRQFLGIIQSSSGEDWLYTELESNPPDPSSVSPVYRSAINFRTLTKGKTATFAQIIESRYEADPVNPSVSREVKIHRCYLVGRSGTVRTTQLPFAADDELHAMTWLHRSRKFLALSKKGYISLSTNGATWTSPRLVSNFNNEMDAGPEGETFPVSESFLQTFF